MKSGKLLRFWWSRKKGKLSRMELCEIPGEGPGKAKGEGERGENALPEEWEETKIRVCSH